MRSRFGALIGLAVAGAQAGHLLSYQLRFGAAARQIETAGAHAYFPAFVRTALGVVALAAIGSLLVIAAARVTSRGRQVHRKSSPTFFGALAVLFTLQLVLFMAQELAESLLAGLPPARAEVLLLWAMVGQLPVAAAGAAVLVWLGERVESAIEVLGSVEPANARLVITAPLSLQPIFTDVAVAAAHSSRTRIVKRGPPTSS